MWNSVVKAYASNYVFISRLQRGVQQSVMHLYRPTVTWRHDVLVFGETAYIIYSIGGSTSAVWIVLCFPSSFLPVFLSVCLSKATNGVKWRSVVGGVRCKYSVFKFEPTFWLSWQNFAVFFRIAACLSHGHLLPKPFQLNVRRRSYTERCLCWATYIRPGHRGGTVVKVLCYKSESHCFDPSWCHWNFSLK